MAALSVGRLAVHEVPYTVGEEATAMWRQYVRDLRPLLAEGRRGDAVALFMRLAGASEEDVTGARGAPIWPGLEEIAPTLVYDIACMEDGPPPVDRLSTIARPTLVVTGGGAPEPAMAGLPADFFERAADEIAARRPRPGAAPYGARRPTSRSGPPTSRASRAHAPTTARAHAPTTARSTALHRRPTAPRARRGAW